MSAVMSVVPGGASHGIDWVVSVSRKNGWSGSGVQVTVQGSRPRPRSCRLTKTIGRKRNRRNGSSTSVPSTSRGSTLIGAVLIDRGRRDVAAGDAHADRAPVARR